MVERKDLSNMDPLYDKKLVCPFCQNRFTSKKVRSRFVKPLRVDSDFAPIFSKDEPNNPLLYFVTVCPQCHLAFTEDFRKTVGTTAKQLLETEIRNKRGRILDYCCKRDVQLAVSAYKLAIYTAQVSKERHYVFGNLCLRLAWLYRGLEQEDEELRFLKLALEEFQQSYIHSDFKNDTTPEMQVLYLVGELNRRVGNYHDSIKYFGTVIEHPDKSRYMRYVNLAREQWRKGVEEYKEKKNKDNIKDDIEIS